MPPSTLRHLVLAAIDAQPRAAHALEAVDHRPALEILQVRCVSCGLPSLGVDTEIGDVALVLQHLEDRSLELRGGERAPRPCARVCPLRMRVSRSAIGSVMLMLIALLTSSLWSGPESRRASRPRGSSTRARPNLRYTPRERPVIAQRLRWRVGLASRGSACKLGLRGSALLGRGLRAADQFLQLRAPGARTSSRSAARRFSRSTMLVLAIAVSLVRVTSRNGKLKASSSARPCLLSLRRRGNGDVHAPHLIDLRRTGSPGK